MNLNKVLIIGRLTADPQVRSTPSGQSVSSFSMATNRYWKDQAGNKKEETEFHNIVAWGRNAEIVRQFLVKGSIAMIEGRLKTRTWQDQQGQNRRTTEIIADNLQLGPRPAGSSFSGNNNFSPAPTPNPTPSNNNQNDSPFSDDKKESLPTIDLDDSQSEIKDEDLPF